MSLIVLKIFISWIAITAAVGSLLVTTSLWWFAVFLVVHLGLRGNLRKIIPAPPAFIKAIPLVVIGAAVISIALKVPPSHEERKMLLLIFVLAAAFFQFVWDLVSLRRISAGG